MLRKEKSGYNITFQIRQRKHGEDAENKDKTNSFLEKLEIP